MSLWSLADGIVDPSAVQAAVDKYGEDIAGMMMTCPNTLGLMERNLKDIVRILHSVDALLYYDGANMNAIMGRMRVGDVGFDCVHLNLHKTFATPHGGGGPGSGPVGCSERLLPFLPSPRVEKRADGTFGLMPESSLSIGHIGPFYGSFGIITGPLPTWSGSATLVSDALPDYSVLNANYLRKKLEDVLQVTFNRICMHEFVASAPEGMRALDIAKGLLERGYHAPTIYFPLLVHDASCPNPRKRKASRRLTPSPMPSMRSWPKAGRIPKPCFPPRTDCP